VAGETVGGKGKAGIEWRDGSSLSLGGSAVEESEGEGGVGVGPYPSAEALPCDPAMGL
jgi:hypothetical protein